MSPGVVELRTVVPAADAELARALLRIQHAAYAVEAELIGDDRIPPLHETLADLRAAPLTWLAALTTGLIPSTKQPDPAQTTSAIGAVPRTEQLPAASGVRAVAVPAASVVGAVAWTEEPDTVDIDRLLVSPTAHRQGIGSALVRAVLTHAGARRTLVSTGRANHPARALYERLGFTHTHDTEPIPHLWIAHHTHTP